MLPNKIQWRRQAILTRIRQALDAFMSLQDVDWNFNVKKTLDEILMLAVKELDFEGEKEIERGLLLVIPPDGGPFEVRAGYMADDDVVFSHTIVEEAIKKGDGILCTNACQDPRFRHAESIRALSVLSCIAVPLLLDKKVFGAVYVESRSPRNIFVEEDRNFLREFADTITPYAQTALTHEKHIKEIQKLRKEVAHQFHFDNIIGRSPPMAQLFELARVAAQGDQTVLITGESGSGKELLARAIHHNSPRRDMPLVIVDCSALTQELLESELFGHLKGAFTGASKDKRGAFEEADGGTVFLDEISDASKPLQQSLRRVLQEGTIRPVGSAAHKKVDVRVITATNQDLRDNIEKGTFLRDLYFRINRFPITIPPLRERPDDIPLLSLNFLKNAPQHKTPKVTAITPDAMDYLVTQQWTDNNVRELRNTIELSCDLAPASVIERDTLVRVKKLLGRVEDPQAPPGTLVTVHPNAFPVIFNTDGDEKPYRLIETQFAGQVIVNTLKRCEWKLRRAATLLGLSPGKTRDALKQYLVWAQRVSPTIRDMAEKTGLPREILLKKLDDLGLPHEATPETEISRESS